MQARQSSSSDSDEPRKPGRTAALPASTKTDNRGRLEYAKLSIEEMAVDAIRQKRSGTIGVEISVKDGQLGKVKRLLIDFQTD